MIDHLIISLTSLLVLLGVVLSFTYFFPDVMTEPQKYFDLKMPTEEFQFIVLQSLFVISSILFSYIVYLWLSLRTRAEMMVFVATKSLNTFIDQFAKLFEEAPVPYIILDKDGNIRKPNKAALRFFGVTANEIDWKNFFGYQFDEDQTKIDQLIRYYRSGIPVENRETKMIAKNGDSRYVLISIFRLNKFENLDKAGLVTIFDITEQKKLDQAKTEFVSLASHQLRTPVATIKWYADMLLSSEIGELNPKQNDYIFRIHKVNDGMNDLVETLLNVSRIEIGSLIIDKKSTNVADLTENILLELSAPITEKKLNIEKKYDGNLTDIKSDPKLLRIIIQNLLSNAVKYTPTGGTVTILFKESFMEKQIIVSDTGVGIPKNQQSKIFTKMFRADNVRNLYGNQGTGLGLYLIKSITEAMGGHLSFVSEENKGSTFVVKF